MADSILRLKVESSEYDAKLKKAAEGIRHLAEVAHKSGGDLTGLEKAELDYIRALGEMETKSRSAAGKVRELESTFKELKVIYDQLNDVEKADEGGKALAASLEQIKQRAQEARAQLDSASKSLNDNGQQAQQSSSMLDALASKFTVNIDALKLFDMGLKAAGVALDVAKDAFFASETNVDEWGRTIASAQSLYEGFLTAINNGDISGFLSRMDEIVKAARAAYNELDTLGTMKTIQAPRISAQQTENERIRSMIQTGRYIAPIDGRRNATYKGHVMQSGDKLDEAQIRMLERQLQNGMQSLAKMVGNEVKQTGKAINAYYNSLAKQNGMSFQEFKKGTSSWESFSKKLQGYEEYRKWDAQARTEFARQGGQGNVDFDKNNPYREFRKWGTFRVDRMGENSFNDLVRLILQRDQQAGQAYGMQSQAYRTMNRIEGFNPRKVLGGGSGSGSGSKSTQEEKDEFVEINGLIGEAQERVADLQKQIRESWDEGRIEELNSELVKAQEELKRLQDLGKPIDFDKLFPMKNLENDKTSMPSLSKFDKAVESARINLSDKNISVDQQSIDSLLSVIINSGMGDVMVDSAPFAQIFANAMNIPDDAFEEFSQQFTDKMAATDLIANFQEMLAEGLDVPDEAFENLQEKINEKLKEMGLDPINLDLKTGKLNGDEGEDKESGTEKLLKGINKLSGGLSSIASGLSSIGIELPKEISAAINVISGVGQIISGVQAVISLFSASDTALKTQEIAQMTVLNGELTVLNGLLPALIAAAAMPFQLGGVVHAAQGFSGTVPGMSYSGDNIPIMANAGEVVLTRAQAGVIADAVSGGDGGGGVLYTEVSGDALRIILDRSSRKRSKGKYMTTKMKN